MASGGDLAWMHIFDIWSTVTRIWMGSSGDLTQMYICILITGYPRTMGCRDLTRIHICNILDYQ